MNSKSDLKINAVHFQTKLLLEPPKKVIFIRLALIVFQSIEPQYIHVSNDLNGLLDTNAPIIVSN